MLLLKLILFFLFVLFESIHSLLKLYMFCYYLNGVVTFCYLDNDLMKCVWNVMKQLEERSKTTRFPLKHLATRKRNNSGIISSHLISFIIIHDHINSTSIYFLPYCVLLYY
jgi:hypothetical protein